MPQTPTRRASTGGKAPRKYLLQYVIEEMPSHDNTPCFTAWERAIRMPIPEKYARPQASDSDSDNEDRQTRPKMSFQIYDTTPLSDNADHLKALAEKIHKETFRARWRIEFEFYDRIDLWGMPLAVDASTEERITKCRAHACAVIASRERADDTFHVSRLINHLDWPRSEDWNRVIIIIDRAQELWNENEGGFLAVYWDLSSENPAATSGEVEGLLNGQDEGRRAPEMEVLRRTYDGVGTLMKEMREAFQDFWE
ncbi:hypothetical protein CcaCcLH18_00399 [Colletotrichum camelliae]|nr:hypothetical protein CcaCcLH18_00399 [Colletotrichum camelliae]